MKKNLISVMLCLFITTVFGLTGCGGGGGGGGGDVAPPIDTVSGIVSVADKVLSGTVYLTDSSIPPKKRFIAIAADGSYSIDVTGLTKPYLLKAYGTANGHYYNLYALAADKGSTNISQVTILDSNTTDIPNQPFSQPFSPPESSPVSYIGATTKADITKENAKVLTYDVIFGGKSVLGAVPLQDNGLAKVLPGQQSTPDGIRYANLIRSMIKNVSGRKVLRKSLAAVVNESWTEYGFTDDSSSGTVYLSGSYNEDTGDFTFNVGFNSYMPESAGPALSGTATFTGKESITTEELIYGTMNLELVSNEISLKGSITVEYDQLTSVEKMTLDLVRTDKSANISIWFNNLQYVFKDFGSYEEYTVTGKYYNSTDGWVLIETEQPFKLLYGYSPYPISGIGVAKGANSYARLTCSTSGYVIELDSDGPGTNVYVVVEEIKY